MAKTARFTLRKKSMQSFDILRPGVWFGPLLENSQNSQQDSADERGQLQFLCDCLKRGDFTVRPQMEVLIRCCRDSAIRKQAIRLYCYTSRHQDIAFICSLLENLGHEDILTIAVTAPDTLSPEVVPYLFTLLGEYADTSIAPDILSSIDRIFPWGYTGGDEDLIKLAENFSGFAKALKPGGYYYGGELVHPGGLCKRLIEVVIQSKHTGNTFPLANVPTLLSIWSGEKCPIYYGQHVDDKCVQDVFSYVSRLASLQWEPGKKYFYRHLIE